MSPQAVVHLAVRHAGDAADPVPGGLTLPQYAVLGGCVLLLALLGLLGLLAGPGRSGMASGRVARRLVGESGLRDAAGQLRPSLEDGRAAHQRAVPGPRGPVDQRAPRGTAAGEGRS